MRAMNSGESVSRFVNLFGESGERSAKTPLLIRRSAPLQSRHLSVTAFCQSMRGARQKPNPSWSLRNLRHGLFSWSIHGIKGLRNLTASSSLLLLKTRFARRSVSGSNHTAPTNTLSPGIAPAALTRETVASKIPLKSILPYTPKAHIIGQSKFFLRQPSKSSSSKTKTPGGWQALRGAVLNFRVADPSWFPKGRGFRKTGQYDSARLAQ